MTKRRRGVNGVEKQREKKRTGGGGMTIEQSCLRLCLFLFLF